MDLLENQDTVRVDTKEIRDINLGICRPPQTTTNWPQLHKETQPFQLEDETNTPEPLPLVPAPSRAGEGSKNVIIIDVDDDKDPNDPSPAGSGTNLMGDSESDRASRLFPNSFKITGFKHISDNALHMALTSLPQCF